MTTAERNALQRMAASTSLPHRKVVQARALLWAGDGVSNQEIGRRSGVDSDAVRRWRARFGEKRVDGVGVIGKGRGRKPSLPAGTVAEVLRITQHERPADGSTHWTTRTLAAKLGIGKDAVARIWSDHNLKPWRVETFKISNDPQFEEKLVDVVGLYVNPPDGAAVFSLDEKTQCQALDRTQPSLPLRHGRAGTMTHDYKRQERPISSPPSTSPAARSSPIAARATLRSTSWSSSSASMRACRASCPSTSSSTICPRTRHRRSPNGWLTGAGNAGISASRPPPVPGSISSSAGSRNSSISSYAGASSPTSPISSRRSRPGPPTGTWT